METRERFRRRDQTCEKAELQTKLRYIEYELHTQRDCYMYMTEIEQLKGQLCDCHTLLRIKDINQKQEKDFSRNWIEKETKQKLETANAELEKVRYEISKYKEKNTKQEKELHCHKDFHQQEVKNLKKKTGDEALQKNEYFNESL